MHRPPPKYFWNADIKNYEKHFGEGVPPWVLTLDNKDGRVLLQSSIKIGWRLPTEVLVSGEHFYGKGSLWEDCRNVIFDQPIGTKKPN